MATAQAAAPQLGLAAMVRLGQILSYQGGLWDCALNYSATALLGAAFVAEGRAVGLGARAVRRRFAWLSGVALYQLGLCYAVDCVGISLVWNAMLGWLAYRYAQSPADRCSDPRLAFGGVTARRWFQIGAGFAGLTNLYYAVAEDGLTTLAHALALVLGWGLAALEARLPAS
jgi:hypothetical protein